MQNCPVSSLLQAAAASFVVTPIVGQPADFTMTGKLVEQVIGDLRSTVVLLVQGETTLCLISAPFPVDGRPSLRNATKAVLAAGLGLDPSQIVATTPHTHTIAQLRLADPLAPAGQDPGETNELGRQYLAGLTTAAAQLRSQLVPVTLSWGNSQEPRFIYNRRGRRPDGTSYFIREEDRLLLPPDYVGEIDADAPVVIFSNAEGRPVAAFALFTAHPVTAYNPEHPVSFGSWPQLASERLSAFLGGAPVAFLQGCAGDINSKFLLTGTVEQARQMGELLGEAFVTSARAARPSQRNDLAWVRVSAPIPCADLPDTESLEASLREIDDFVRRAEAGDPDTLLCVGMNFPQALSPVYRARLVDSVRRWYVWALDQQRSGQAANLPKSWPQEIVVARIGDIGLTGFKFEAFVRTGLKIKREAPLPLVLTACYMEGGEGYIPDATACDDREYQAGHFRYLGDRPPYKAPGGDAAATVAVETLGRLLTRAQS